MSQDRPSICQATSWMTVLMLPICEPWPSNPTQNSSLTCQSGNAKPYAANLSASCPRLQIPKLSELWPQPSKPQCSRSIYHMEAFFNHRSNIHTTTYNLQPHSCCAASIHGLLRSSNPNLRRSHRLPCVTDIERSGASRIILPPPDFDSENSEWDIIYP